MAFFIGCGIVLRQAEKYVLITEVRHEKAGLYNLPAGTVEIHEDFLQCIAREAKEETGADVSLEGFLGVYQTVIASGNNVVFVVFTGSVPIDAQFSSEEHEEIQVLSYEEVEKLDNTGSLRSPIVLKAISDEKAGRTLPLSTVQTWHIEGLDAITVEKDH